MWPLSDAAPVYWSLILQQMAMLIHKYNGESNDLKMRIIICLRKYEVTVERNSVCYVLEKLVVHDIQCMPCFYTNDIINLLL